MPKSFSGDSAAIYYTLLGATNYGFALALSLASRATVRAAIREACGPGKKE